MFFMRNLRLEDKDEVVSLQVDSNANQEHDAESSCMAGKFDAQETNENEE